MPTLALTGGAYQARSVIASAQRSLNLMGEPMPQAQGEPGRVAHYPTPGLRLLGTLPKGGVRGLKQATNGNIYAVGGNSIYRVNPTTWVGTELGTITSGRPYPVSMADNGNTLVVVDGSAGGWTVQLASDAFAAISDTAFYGADKVDYLDTYFLFNKPGTPQFYVSDSLATTFDPLWFANKESFSDLLTTLIVARREIWLIGERATEVWSDVGAPDFPFQEVPSVFIDHGSRAKYSVATYDDTVFWLSYNRQGGGIVLAGAGYQTKRISSYALEASLASYSRTDDAIGFVYSLGGHVCYVLVLPTADATWVYDTTTGWWHEWKWLDTNGVEHRHRANCCYAINGTVVVGDWESGNLYAVENTALTDNGAPIKRQRSFPHLLNQADRVYYRQLIADIESGLAPQAAATTSTQISCTFTAPDGTLLESYSNSNDINATWTRLSGEAQVLSDKLTGPNGGGSGVYESLAVSQADYTLQFSAVPSTYSSVGTAGVYVLARSTGIGTGYRAEISGDGAQYWLRLGVEGGSSTSLAMGTVPSGAFTATLTLAGTLITLSVQRSSDGLALTASGAWDVAGTALTLVDGTYTAAGHVLLGGDW